jgi:hypothetical protein
LFSSTGLSVPKMGLINGFFETYLSLNESEEKALMEDLTYAEINPDK